MFETLKLYLVFSINHTSTAFKGLISNLILEITYKTYVLNFTYLKRSTCNVFAIRIIKCSIIKINFCNLSFK